MPASKLAVATLALLGLLGRSLGSLAGLARVASVDSSKTHECKAPLHNCTSKKMRGFADHSEQAIN